MVVSTSDRETFSFVVRNETVTEYDVNFTPFVLNSHSIDRPFLTSLFLEMNSGKKAQIK